MSWWMAGLLVKLGQGQRKILYVKQTSLLAMHLEGTGKQQSGEGLPCSAIWQPLQAVAGKADV